MLSVPGLGSGLDVNGMVSQLVAAERAPSDKQLNRENARVSSQLSAFGQLKSAVSGLQSSLSGLNNLASFSNRKATSSDNATIAVTAASAAVPNSYAVTVSQLADTHSLAGAAVADKNESALGTGTISIRLGTTDYDADTDTYNGFTLNPDTTVTSIEIDSGNNTLEGIMQAINEAGAGVRASIVNDGSGYRLLLTSEASGAANSMEISVIDGDGNDSDAGGLSRFAFNAQATHMEQTNAARDAQITVNGLAVSSASNTVSGVIEGVTMTLKKTSAESVNLQVSEDSSAVTGALNSFIKGYNGFVTTANVLTRYDAENGSAGALLGDSSVRALRGQVDRILRNAVDGLSGGYATMFEVGISTNSDGTLKLDSAKFDQALSDEPQAVKALFAALGVPTDADIAYQGAGDAAVVGDYAIDISALATAGSYAGTGALPDFSLGQSLVIDDGNDSFSLEVDGVAAGEVSLTQGTYTSGEDLAAEIQARINGMSALKDAGVAVAVSYDAGTHALTITSESSGSTSSVELTAVDTDTAAELGLDVGAGTAGTDVAGTIGGLAADGAGQVLTGAEGSDVEGISLLVGGSATGARGSLNFTRGLVNQLDLLLQQVLDEEGSLESRIGSLEDRSEDIADRREALELRWEKVEERYLRQFTQLDGLLAQLQATSSYLETQLANLPKISLRNNK